MTHEACEATHRNRGNTIEGVHRFQFQQQNGHALSKHREVGAAPLASDNGARWVQTTVEAKSELVSDDELDLRSQRKICQLVRGKSAPEGGKKIQQGRLVRHSRRSNGMRISCGRPARRRKGGGRQSAPTSFKRMLDSRAPC